jgi:hypothetical protein
MYHLESRGALRKTVRHIAARQADGISNNFDTTEQY